MRTDPAAQAEADEPRAALKIGRRHIKSRGKVNTKSEDREFIGSLARGLAILSGFTPHKPALTLSEVARSHSLNLPTARRYLHTFKRLGYIFYEEESKKYRLTSKVLRLGGWLIESIGLRSRLLPYLNSITRELGITTSCAILEGSEVVTVERMRSPDVINLDLTAGSRLPIHATSLGKAIAAFLSRDELRELMAQIEFVRYTKYTKTNPKQFLEELKKTQKRGYATSNQELTLSLKSFAVPIFDKNAKIEASFGVSYPSHRSREEGLEKKILQRLLDVSLKTSGAYPDDLQRI
jgi:IclR family transcriptional regulator, pca regulon regulatory protein